MKIGHKLMLGFVGLALLMAGLGYFALRTSQTTLEEAIGKNSADIAEQILDKISRNIHTRVEEIQALAADELTQQYLPLSNAQFENMSDPNGYIAQIDRDWTNGADLHLISELSHNELARELQSRQKFYQNKYGYPLVGEIFVTNRYGANAAQTGRTTDYYQADEEWWQIAKRDGLFVSNITYDKSSKIFSTEIAIRIDDANGNFIGVIKATPNIKETINIINEAKLAAEYKTTQLHLIKSDGNIIYSTKGYGFLADVDSQIVPRCTGADRPGHKCYFIGEKAGEKGMLFAHAHSHGYKDFKGLGWTLVTETNTAEIFAPIVSLRDTMLLAGVAIMGLALLASSITYRSIVVPIAELQKATIQIASGDLDTNLTKPDFSEIGQLANSFQRMAQRLKKTISDLNDEIDGRKKTEEKLRQNQQFLGNIFDSIEDGIGIMDKDLNIIRVNPWLEETHRDCMPLVGKKCFEAYHHRDSACPGCPCVETLKTGKPHALVIPNPCSGNKAEWVELSAFPLKDHDGNITGVIEYIKDVTEQIKTEQALRMSEQRFSQVVENAREWVWEVNADGLYTYASPVVKEILGFSPDELEGKKYFYDMFHPDDREAMKTKAIDILTKKQTFRRSNHRNLHKDGHTVWLSTSGVPMLNEQGELLGYRGVDADITEQRKAETLLTERAEQIMRHHNTLLKLANIPEQDLDSLFRLITEQDSEVLNVAQVGIGFFNQEKTEIVCRDLFIKAQKVHETGHSLKTCDYPHYLKAMENSRILAANNSLSDMRTCEFAESYLKPKDINSIMHVPIRLHGQMIGIICHEHIGPAREWTSTEQDFAASVADMIALKLEAAERTKAEQTLEKLNKDLEAAVQELSQSNRQLQDFVHIAAHDLKTPVRGIGTLADWIISDYGDRFDEQGREQIRLLKARVIRIDKLIDGMLQFSKLARTKEKERQVDLNMMLSEVIRGITTPDNIEIAMDSLPDIACEYEHLELVFQNLLTNAVIFMDKTKGLIKVGCVEQGDFWKFYICDNGPGIDQKYFDKIFKIFQTLPRKDESETAGIGLAVVKKIVELYGGKIWVESRPGSGSTFFFTFPRHIEEPVYAKAKANTAC
jgi:PAS domain S-box-containing protein